MDNQLTIELLASHGEKTAELVLQLTNRYLDMQAEISQQKRVIGLQGNLINQCMERIMTLEGRGILGNFNQRLETLEANKGKMYEVSHTKLSKMLENAVERVDHIESWLYTHEYDYFQEEENKTGNSSFEEYEMHHPEDTTGTHTPNCRCAWCEPQEGMTFQQFMGEQYGC